MDGALPIDDGMRAVREQLQAIRTLAVSTEEKARRMHALMTRAYIAHKANIDVSSPSDLQNPRLMLPADLQNPYNLRPGDLEPTFSPIPVALPVVHSDRTESSENENAAVLGCAHYKRNVKVQCYDCQRWFTCRHCHDQAPDLPYEHKLNRKKTQNMLCMLCCTPQPAAEVCMHCGEYAAWYYCSKCKLWDNDSNKRIYHCDDCGICRVGEGLGKDYVHCRRCNVCITISTSASHPCIERATEGDCPLCLVRLFESTTSVVSLPCGHYMHGDCYKDLMAVTYKCPVCSKSAVNMELQWRKLDDEIRAQPMPEDDDDLEGLLPQIQANPDADGVLEVAPEARPRRPRTVYIGCNDCGRRSWSPFHWLGLKCQVCDSYNTNQMAPTAVPETDAERLIRQQQQHHLPTSPSQLAVNGGSRARSAQSPPGRRYFVQEEERRPSFTAPRFSTPTLPTLPNMPTMPTLPTLANLPNLPEMPRLPRMPRVPNLPDWPNLPNMPNMPNLELPRFSPYEMFDAVSRSLSPMRYYLAGLDVGEGSFRRRSSATADRNRSPTSIHSDPTGTVTVGKTKRKLRNPQDAVAVDDDAVEFWGSDGQLLSSGEEGTDDSIHAVRRRDESSSESESDDEMRDAEMLDDDDEDGEGEDGEEMELFGHR
ncbi:hypothetical protein BAUCODRAFT_87724 [Baudoinia panamericana UAMH 10762]|uniref:Zf-CHY-domain-containing protein n=1 Tax=Baudoinia panamericana (strain UAMH 10762) TaxID=717646 RepID=M2MK89_BAUPA|nr:uncharacterized protein BAUCODRAFT_87724 [Baudoinia panamericana UAMH 10762]EMC97106.1 hypothetical protein BAUCODRAFT_87724 [Baudoinia panamericana UAMH 10762]